VNTRMTCALSAVGALGASLALATPTLAATTPTLYVNGSNGSDTTATGANTCRLDTHPCATIQHAINEAPATAKITVAAGLYPEQLVISGKNLSISGVNSGKDSGNDPSVDTIIQPTSLAITQNDPTHPGTNQADIVTFSGAKSGGLSDLTVDGSQATETDGATNYVGVFMLNSAGTLSGDQIENVQHDQGSFGDQPGANGGVLVANSDGKARTVTMSSLDVTAYDKNGITCRSIGTTCNISDSTVAGIGATGLNAQNGIELYGITGASVKDTSVENNTYTSPNYPTSFSNGTGILVINVGKLSLTGNDTEYNDENIAAIEDQSDFVSGPAQGAWTISGNTASNATNEGSAPDTTAVPFGDQVGDGIDLEGASKATVENNTVENNADWGIALFGAVGSKIGAANAGNTVTGNDYDGIYLGEYVPGQPSKSNIVSYNTSSDNGHDGILASGNDSSGDAQAIGNTFGHNTLSLDGTYDAEDDSTGAKTAHTANTWTGNTCTPAGDAVPGAICS
jgi:parallel beta-helix repeat protein